jgi:hypothetical protein
MDEIVTTIKCYLQSSQQNKEGDSAVRKGDTPRHMNFMECILLCISVI